MKRTKGGNRCTDKAIRWADGRMVKFEIASDITDLKQVEEELRRGKRTIEALLNATPDVVILLDAGGTLEELNEGARSFLGKTRDELIGSNLFAALTGGDNRYMGGRGPRVPVDGAVAAI